MTRLEAHRKALEKEERHGPLLRIEDLNPEEIAIINASFLDLCRKRRVSDINETYSAYVDTLHTWGVMCPHPQPHRLYDGRKPCDHPLSFESSRWFDCTLCGAAVVNR
jgi:hypothetical protein